MDHTRQTFCSDPREFAGLLAELPAEIPALAAAVRNLIVHYRASGLPFPPDRLAEINSRRVDRMLAADQGRFPGSLLAPRPQAERIVGCCRDFTLLSMAALRLHGIPARSRVGFAAYFDGDPFTDHVITEWWDGSRWRAVDMEVDPEWGLPVDAVDVPLSSAGLNPASRVWRAYRRGELDPELYGVGGVPHLRGPWFIRNYVLHEVAHRHGDEHLLWDIFGAMSLTLDGDLTLIDTVADLLIAADEGNDAAARELSTRYAADPRLHPGRTVTSHSPVGPITEVKIGDAPESAPV